MLGFRPHRVVVNTIGTVHVACCNGATAEFKMTSGAAATNSGAYLRKIPSGCLQERLNASLRLRIVAGDNMSTPTRRIVSGCYARAASGHAAAAPPTIAIKSRRFMCGWPPPGKRSFGVQRRGRLQSCVRPVGAVRVDRWP
jgi:hypothetical protein